MPSRHTASFKNIAQLHSSKMSASKQPASTASSQSPRFTNLSWMEINASVGPRGCSCTLSTLVSVCMPCVFLHRSVATYTTLRNPSSMDTTLKKSYGLLPIWPVHVCPLYCDGLSVCRVFQCVGEMYPPTLLYITLLDGGVKKNGGKKKGASFSPYQLRKAMLCPCNWVGISSINSATLDNKYRVHRQLLWDLKRGCVKEYVCVRLCAHVHVC